MLPKLTFALEGIFHQLDSTLGKELEDAIADLQKENKTIRQNDLRAANLENIVEKHLGLSVDFNLDKSAGAYVYIPHIDPNSIMIDDELRHYFKTVTMPKILKDKKVLEGQVDLVKAKVSGDLCSIVSPIHVCQDYFTSSSRLTPAEITGIILHEIGHIFVYFEMMTRLTRTNYIMTDVLENLMEVKDKKEKLEMLTRIEKLTKSTIENKEKIAERSINKDKLTVVVLCADIEKSKNDLGADIYSQRGYEQLADNFASRFGYAVPLATGLNKIYKQFGDMATRSPWLHCFMEICSMFLTAGLAYLALTTGFYYFAYLFVYRLVMATQANNSSYDDPKERVKKLKNQINDLLKNPDLTIDQKRKLVEDHNNTTKVLDMLYDNIGWAEALWKLSFGRKSANVIKEQDLLEGLANNDLFAAAATVDVFKDKHYGQPGTEAFDNWELDSPDPDGVYRAEQPPITMDEFSLTELTTDVNKDENYTEVVSMESNNSRYPIYKAFQYGGEDWSLDYLYSQHGLERIEQDYGYAQEGLITDAIEFILKHIDKIILLFCAACAGLIAYLTNKPARKALEKLTPKTEAKVKIEAEEIIKDIGSYVTISNKVNSIVGDLNEQSKAILDQFDDVVKGIKIIDIEKEVKEPSALHRLIEEKAKQYRELKMVEITKIYWTHTGQEYHGTNSSAYVMDGAIETLSAHDKLMLDILKTYSKIIDKYREILRIDLKTTALHEALFDKHREDVLKLLEEENIIFISYGVNYFYDLLRNKYHGYKPSDLDNRLKPYTHKLKIDTDSNKKLYKIVNEDNNVDATIINYKHMYDDFNFSTGTLGNLSKSSAWGTIIDLMCNWDPRSDNKYDGKTIKEIQSERKRLESQKNTLLNEIKHANIKIDTSVFNILTNALQSVMNSKASITRVYIKGIRLGNLCYDYYHSINRMKEEYDK